MGLLTTLKNLINTKLSDVAGVGVVPEITPADHRAVETALADELKTRGVYYAATTGDLSSIPSTETDLVLVEGKGFFRYSNAALTANGATIFAASITGFWVLQRFNPRTDTLSDSANVVVNAVTHDNFDLLLTDLVGSTRSMANPTGGYDGQVITLTITQGVTPPHAVTWGSKYRFAENLPFNQSVGAGQRDKYRFQYSADADTWDCIFSAINFQ